MNVGSTVSKKMCSGCGVCSLTCPVGAIKITFCPDKVYRAELNEKLCKNCGRCQNVCPDLVREKPLTTPQYFIGQSESAKQREASASGGLLTELLVFLLQEGHIDGAVVVGDTEERRSNEPLFMAKVVTTAEEIKKAAKSKYYPVEFSQAITAARAKNLKKIAVVALPCAAKALDRLRKTQKEYEIIKYIFSPVCGHTVSGNFISHIVKKLNLDENYLATMSFREKDNIRQANNFKFRFLFKQPGCEPKTVDVFFKDPLLFNLWTNNLYALEKCHFCSDFVAQEADCCFADAWLPELKKAKGGQSMMIVKNEELLTILQRMVGQGIISLTYSSPEDFKRAQKNQIEFKEKYLAARLKVASFFGYTPTIQNNEKLPWLDVVKAFWYFTKIKLFGCNINPALFSYVEKFCKLCNPFWVYRKIIKK